MPRYWGKTEEKRIEEPRLQRVPRGAYKIAQHGYVWFVCADSPRIHWKPQPLGKFQIHARVIKFRKTKTLRWQHAIQPRRINRPRRTVRPPRAARHLIKLFPIAFVPGGHTISLFVLLMPLDAASIQKVHQGFLLRLSSGTPLSCPSYSYTSAISMRSTFLACCIKHVTGRFVSRVSEQRFTVRRAEQLFHVHAHAHTNAVSYRGCFVQRMNLRKRSGIFSLAASSLKNLARCHALGLRRTPNLVW